MSIEGQKQGYVVVWIMVGSVPRVRVGRLLDEERPMAAMADSFAFGFEWPHFLLVIESNSLALVLSGH